MPRVRDFNPRALAPYNDKRIKAALSGKLEGAAWHFTLFLPLWFTDKKGFDHPVCTEADEGRLFKLLMRDFGGVTVDTSPVRGIGLRNRRPETNIHRRMTVLTSKSRATTRYFRALRQELEASSGEDQILILREELAVV